MAHATPPTTLATRKRFAEPPFSNGHDRRYEKVKAELRGIYGRAAISEKNKKRLKALAGSKKAKAVAEREALAFGATASAMLLVMVARNHENALRARFKQWRRVV